MKRLKLPASVIAMFIGGVWLLQLTHRGGQVLYHALPLVTTAMGLLLAGTALSCHVALYDWGCLPFHRKVRLTLLGGLTLGTTLALLGLFAALTTLL